MSDWLLLDLGNSRLKWRSCTADGRLGEAGLLPHQGAELGSGLAAALRFASGRPALAASVARPQLRAGLEALATELPLHLEWARTPRQGLGIHCVYPEPRKWGVDRWLALAAAYQQSAAPCCVIDIGTAITVDVCDAEGRQQGGLIAPGPVALQQALAGATALPPAASDWPARLGLATDTEDALLLGALHAACGLIERSHALAVREHGCGEALLTGGGAALLSPYLDLPHRIDEDLVFKGLAALAASR